MTVPPLGVAHHVTLDILPNSKAPVCNFFQNNDQQAFWHN